MILLMWVYGNWSDITRLFAVSVIINNQVVFLEPAEARSAFRGLAYKRYK